MIMMMTMMMMMMLIIKMTVMILMLVVVMVEAHQMRACKVCGEKDHWRTSAQKDDVNVYRRECSPLAAKEIADP